MGKRENPEANDPVGSWCHCAISQFHWSAGVGHGEATAHWPAPGAAATARATRAPHRAVLFFPLATFAACVFCAVSTVYIFYIHTTMQLYKYSIIQICLGAVG